MICIEQIILVKNVLVKNAMYLTDFVMTETFFDRQDACKKIVPTKTLDSQKNGHSIQPPREECCSLFESAQSRNSNSELLVTFTCWSHHGDLNKELALPTSSSLG